MALPEAIGALEAPLLALLDAPAESAALMGAVSPRLGEPKPEENLRELSLLVRVALQPAVPARRAPASTLRLGHQIEQTGEIRPVLAEMLADGVVPSVPDYPDDEVVRALTAADLREAARALAGSPARRLARWPASLESTDALVPCSGGWSRLLAAPSRPVPLPGGTSVPVWTTLHCDVPWRVAAEVLLVGDRWSSALAESVRRELSPGEREPEREHWLHLWTVALRHSARLATPHIDSDEGSEREDIEVVWALGAWIVRVLAESPFLGADPELLAGRVEPLLQNEDCTARSADVLWPARFGRSEAQIDLGQLYALSALARVVDRSGLPETIVSTLLLLSGRATTAAEAAAETALRGGRDATGWPAPHVAPPLLALWLLHRGRVDWFRRVNEDVRRVVLRELADSLRAGRGTIARWILAGVARAQRTGSSQLPSEAFVIEAWEEAAGAGEILDDDTRGQWWVVGLALPDAAARLNMRAKSVGALISGLAPAWRAPVLFEAANDAALGAATAAELLALATSGAGDIVAARTLVILVRRGTLPRDLLRRLDTDAPDAIRRHPDVSPELVHLGSPTR